MRYRRVAVPVVVGAVVLTAVAFGPLVSGLSLASEATPTVPNDGTLTIASVDFPTEATIGAASYGAANAYLSVPPATVAFGTIRGHPTLVYQLRIGSLNHSVSTTHFLDADKHGPTYEATIDTMSIDDSKLQNDQYPGELAIIVRDSDGRQVVARQNVTVQVVE